MVQEKLAKQFILSLLFTVTLISITLCIAFAETAVNVIQAYVNEQTLTVFTDIELNSDGLKCTISNQSADIKASGSLSDENTLTKTTILLDISTSMPSALRSKVLSTLSKLIELKPMNEEFRLIVFGGDITTIHDFSADRYDLATAIADITFDGKQSNIYDTIYSTIPHIAPSDEKPTFFRTIVFTDGVDNTTTGITKEELFIKLQTEYYPVDIIAVSDAGTVEDKDLAAIVRMSGGRYHLLSPEADPQTLATELSVTDFGFVEAIVPAVLLDGTIRQVDIADDSYCISLDAKFPVFSVQSIETPAESLKETPSGTMETTPVIDAPVSPKASASPKPVIPPAPNEQVGTNSPTTMFGELTTAILIGSGAALIIFIAVIVIVVVHRKKKQDAIRLKASIAVHKGSSSGNDKTEYYGNSDKAEAQYSIKLSDTRDSKKTWSLPIDGDILIGRAEHCAVHLDDKSVSREHCKITSQGIGLVIVHLSSTNKTILNGNSLSGSAPLQSGDNLKFGRIMLHVDYIQTLGGQPPNSGALRSPYGGMTESIFLGSQNDN